MGNVEELVLDQLARVEREPTEEPGNCNCCGRDLIVKQVPRCRYCEVIFAGQSLGYLDSYANSGVLTAIARAVRVLVDEMEETADWIKS